MKIIKISIFIIGIFILLILIPDPTSIFQTDHRPINRSAIRNLTVMLDPGDTFYPDLLQIDNNQVVWMANEGSDYEIYFWDHSFDSYNKPSNIIKITNNSHRDIEPIIHDGKVAWIGNKGQNSQIYYWDGTYTIEGTTTDPKKLSSDDYYAAEHAIFKGKVVWTGNNAVYYWNGTYDLNSQPNKAVIISHPSRRAYSPEINELMVVWREFDGRDYEICFWDKTFYEDDRPIESKCTDGDYSAYYPKISDDKVVWQRSDSEDSEIYYWDGTYTSDGKIKEIQLSNNSFDDSSPQIYKNSVVWTAENQNIYYWDRTKNTNGIPSNPILLSNNTFGSPGIAESGIVWVGQYNLHSVIYYWDESFKRNQIPSDPIIISDIESDSSSPEISGNSVVWLGEHNGNSTIYYLDLSLIT
jgi:beta propeller repeat protein